MFETLQIQTIATTLARQVVEREHYLHRKPSVSYAYGLYADEFLVGVCTFGVPAGRAVGVSACPNNPWMVLELNRLWIKDGIRKSRPESTHADNTESWFVANCLRSLPPRIVVSYADTAHSHVGGIYRALNFRYAGWTDMSVATVNYDYRLADGRYPSKANPWKTEAGEIVGIKVPRKPKVRYWTTTGLTREMRLWVAQDCAWPQMNWKEDPPPTSHISLKASRLTKKEESL